MKNIFKIFIMLAAVAFAAVSLFCPEFVGINTDCQMAGLIPLIGIPGIENMGGMKARAAFVSQFDVSDVPKIPMRATDAIISTNPLLNLVEGD